MGYGIERDPITGERTGRIVKNPERTVVSLDVPRPATTTLAGGQKTLIMCLACEPPRPKYKLKAIMANHFRKSHGDLYKNKDSWREYARTIILEQ